MRRRTASEPLWRGRWKWGQRRGSRQRARSAGVMSCAWSEERRMRGRRGGALRAWPREADEGSGGQGRPEGRRAAGGGVAPLAQPFEEQRRDLRLGGVAQDEVGAGERGDAGGGSLGVAAGEDDGCARREAGGQAGPGAGL